MSMTLTKVRICKDCGLVVVGKGMSFCSTCKRNRERQQNSGDHTSRLPRYKSADMCRWGKCMTVRVGSDWYCDEHNKQQTDRFRMKRHRAMTDDRLAQHIKTTERLLEELRVELVRRGGSHEHDHDQSY